MRDLVTMWKSTRMIVLTAVCAAIYASVLIPFKPIPIIPGATEIRPANALPVLFSFLFGPAGAWGSAIGNLIGDTFGTLGPGTIFGFFGNLLLGYIPYKFWTSWSRKRPLPDSILSWMGFIVMVLVNSAACALIIGWGLHFMGLVPFIALGNVILINNTIVSLILSPILLYALYNRVEKWGLLYNDLMSEEDISKGKFRKIGTILVSAGALGGMVYGNVVSLAILEQPLFEFASSFTGQYEIGAGLLPAIVLIIVGLLLL
ncbi:MAG: QueT transporter family protein [Acidobacteriota bacterium]